MSARLADLLIRHPLLVMAVLLTVTAAAVALALQIQFDFAPQAMLKGDDNLVRELEDFKRTFAYEDSVLMIVLQATGETDVLTPAALTWQSEVARAVDALPTIERIESLATVRGTYRTLRLPPEIVSRPIITDLPVDEDTAERMQRLVDKSPLMEGSLLSADRRVTVIMAFIQPQVQGLDEFRTVIRSVQNVLAQHAAPSGYRVRLTGLPYLRVDTVDNLQADQRRLLPIAGVLYLSMLTLTFRRVAGSVLPLLGVGMGLAWMVGSIVALGETFNLISNVLPMLMLVIGVSNCVHIVADYGEQSVNTHGNRTDAVRKTVRHMSGACLITLLTNAVGFCSLFSARSDVLKEFGWQAAIGLLCLYVTILGTLGSLMRFFRPPRRSAAGAPLGGVVTAAADAVDRHPRTTLLIGLAGTALALWMARGVHVNSSMIETYGEDHPTLQALRLVEEKLGGLLPIEVSLRARQPGAYLTPDVYRRVGEFERFARSQDGVLFARSYVDFHEAIGAEMTARTARGRPRDDSDEALQRRIERSDWVIDRIADTLNYHVFMTPDGLRARVLLKVRDVGTRRLGELNRKLTAELSRVFPPQSGIEATLTGDAYVNTIAMNNVIHDLFWSLLTASGTIFTIITVGFRSLRIGLIAAIPNFTPLLFTLGYMGWRGYEMNVGNVIVFTISLGIAVDDTVHYLARFREEMIHRRDVLQAVHHTYEASGRAMLIVTLLVISGLAVLLLSDFVPTRRFAELTCVTMATALFGDLLILPACLMVFWGQRQFRK
jgi:predicted RND superfamily exporter protein